MELSENAKKLLKYFQDRNFRELETLGRPLWKRYSGTIWKPARWRKRNWREQV